MFQNARDLYYFCIDFLIKGLILMYSEDGNRLVFSTVSLEHLGCAGKKMGKLGIEMSINTNDIHDYGIEPKTLVKGEGSCLEDYCLYLKIDHVKYIISFHLNRI